MTPIQSMPSNEVKGLKSKIQNRKAALLLALLLLLLATVRIKHDDRNVWRATAPLVKIVALRDRQAGPCVWLYFRGEFWGYWQWGEPPPLPGRPGELKEA